MIKLVTFDFWQTLFADTPETAAGAQALRLAGVREALGRAGRAYDAASLSAADARAATTFAAIWRSHRSMSSGEQVRMFLATLDPALPDALSGEHLAAVTAAYEEPSLRYGPAAAPGAVEAIQWLHARGFTLGVISNTGRTPGTVLRRLLERADVLENFRVFSFSDEVGTRKPAPEIFVRTLTRAGVAPGDAVHLGDDLVNDVAAARAVGMRAIHYAPGGCTAAESAESVLHHFSELPALLCRLP